MVGSRVWVHISKEKRSKLDFCLWQVIFIGYESKNQYWVYNPRIKKIHIAQELFKKEQHRYHCEALNHWDYSDNKQGKTDNAQYASSEDFELGPKETSQCLPNDNIHQVENNAFVPPDLAANNSEVKEQDMTRFNYLESEL